MFNAGGVGDVVVVVTYNIGYSRFWIIDGYILLLFVFLKFIIFIFNVIVRKIFDLWVLYKIFINVFVFYLSEIG